MAITPISSKAFVTLAACEETWKSFAVTVDPYGRDLRFIWAFKIDRAKAHREHFDANHVSGQVSFDGNINGCPYCHTRKFWICNCGTVVCWHGQERVTCPVYGLSGELESVETIDLKGGGL